LRVDARVYVQSPAGVETGLVALWARARRRRFVYWSAHVVDFDFRRFAGRRLVSTPFAIGVRLANTLVLQTQEQALLSQRRFGRVGPVIRYLAEPASPRSPNPSRFLWVGRLAPYKNPTAFVNLAKQLPEASFLMVGAPSALEPDAHREIEHAARALPNLEFIPGLSRSELLPLFDDALALVSTSDYEGMPNVFLEAWARGVPVLALAHDPDGLIVDHALGGFAGGSFDRLLSLVRSMSSERDAADDQAERCRRYVERWHSAEVIVPAWERALQLVP
jgi:glycosyltransferase involved in cell wall biosynthesis